MPRKNDAFVTDLQRFLCLEEAQKRDDEGWNFVASGGDGSASTGSTWTPSEEIIAYVDGALVREDASVSLTGYSDTLCTIYLSKDTTTLFPPLQRVTGTHYLLGCLPTEPVRETRGLQWIAGVDLDENGLIERVRDWRNRLPSTLVVPSLARLNRILEPRRGQIALVADGVCRSASGAPRTCVSSEFGRKAPMYYFSGGDGWLEILDENSGVSLGSDQTIGGIKTFSSFPQIRGSAMPTTPSQFATKAYVDQEQGVKGEALYDMPALEPLKYTQLLINGLAGLTLSHACLATYDQILSNPILVSASPITADTGSGGRARVTFFNAGLAPSFNPGQGAVRIRCQQADVE